MALVCEGNVMDTINNLTLHATSYLCILHIYAYMYVCVYTYYIGTLETLKLLYDEGGIPRLYQGTVLYYYDYVYYAILHYVMLWYTMLSCYHQINRSISLLISLYILLSLRC